MVTRRIVGGPRPTGIVRGRDDRGVTVLHKQSQVAINRAFHPSKLRLDPAALEKLHAQAQTEGTSIAVIVPVLGRPHRVKPLVESFRAATSPEQGSLYFVAQRSDVAEVAAIEEMGMLPILVDDIDRTWAKKINRGYASTSEPWMLLGADDLEFHAGWTDAVLHLLRAHVGVIGTNDMGNPHVISGQHSTHPLVRRSYADTFGTADERMKVVHDGYDHNFPDTELVATAKARGVYEHCSACLVEHLHPAWGKGTTDPIYELGSRNIYRDRSLFEHRSRKFGFDAAGKKSRSYTPVTPTVASTDAPSPAQFALTILVPTVPGREAKLARLLEMLGPQASARGDVELLVLLDYRTMTIGEKRNLMVQCAHGDYVVFVDDDDMVSGDYVDAIVTAIDQDAPDVVCFTVAVEGYGPRKLCRYHPQMVHADLPQEYRRKPNHLMAWRRELASSVKFPALPFGEDTAWGESMAKLANSVTTVDRVLYVYQFDPKDNSSTPR